MKGSVGRFSFLSVFFNVGLPVVVCFHHFHFSYIKFHNNSLQASARPQSSNVETAMQKLNVCVSVCVRVSHSNRI